jgi:hypothetical protein
MLPQNVLINVSVDLSRPTKHLDILAIAAHHFQYHLLQRSLEEGRDADAGDYVGHMQVHQVVAVGVVDSHVPHDNFFIGKNPGRD